MHSTDLKSKTWCDTVFENRNKEYGAYRLRQRAGARYRYALSVVLAGTLLLSFGYVSYVRLLHDQRKKDLAETEKVLRRLVPSELNSGYQIKMLSTARLAPSAAEGEGDKLEGAPVIVDKVTRPMHRGIKQVIQFHPNTEWADEEATDLTTETVTSQILVKQKIIRTDHVSELPEFPGGPRAFMHWLDQNIIYPPYCQKRRIEGNVTVSFIIRKDGYPTDFKIVEASNHLFAQTALNVLKRMPQWKPGKNADGECTPAMVTVPILFKK